jgi:hypothetical protein
MCADRNAAVWRMALNTSIMSACHANKALPASGVHLLDGGGSSQHRQGQGAAPTEAPPAPAQWQAFLAPHLQ